MLIELTEASSSRMCALHHPSFFHKSFAAPSRLDVGQGDAPKDPDKQARQFLDFLVNNTPVSPQSSAHDHILATSTKRRVR